MVWKDKKSRIKLNQLIKNAAENMNKTVSAKYGIAPENIEERSLDPKDGKYFQEVYDFMRLKKFKIMKWELISTIKKLIEENKLLEVR